MIYRTKYLEKVLCDIIQINQIGCIPGLKYKYPNFEKGDVRQKIRTTTLCTMKTIVALKFLMSPCTFQGLTIPDSWNAIRYLKIYAKIGQCLQSLQSHAQNHHPRMREHETQP